MKLHRLFSWLILFILPFFSSCTFPTTANYENILRTWVGAPLDDLVSAWGPPQSSYPLSNGGQVVEYIRTGERTVGGDLYYYPVTAYESGFSRHYGYYSGTSTVFVPQQSPMYTITYVCRTRFTTDNSGIITKWAWEGNNCKALPPPEEEKNPGQGSGSDYAPRK